PKLRNAYSQQWNFTVQREVGRDTMVSIAYVGSENNKTRVGGSRYNVALTPGPGDPALRQLWPYMAPGFYMRSIGRANYNAFQFQVSKKFRGGLDYAVSYTWSKSIDISCSGYENPEGCQMQNPYNLKADRAVSAYDVPHMLTSYWLWVLPIGKARLLRTGNNVADYIIGNWQVNGILSLYSGVPYNIVLGGDIANTGNVGYERPNLLKN